MRLPYSKISPDAFQAMTALGHVIHTESTLGYTLLALVNLRASTLNGCGFCIGMHTHELAARHEPQSRIDAVANWESSDAFTPRERAALAWTDAITNVQQHHASDEQYAAVNEFFTGKDLVDLTWAIASINTWNRVGIAFGAEWSPKVETPVTKKAADAIGGGEKVVEE